METILGKTFNPEKTLVVTPNKRLATYLVACYDDYQKKLGQKVWPTPTILPKEILLKNIWRDFYKGDLFLLNRWQEEALWQDLVVNSRFNSDFCDAASLANEAKRAFALLQDWQVPLDKTSFSYGEENSAFYEIANSFLRFSYDSQVMTQKGVYNNQKKFLSLAMLPVFLGAKIKAQEIILPYQKIILVGFDQITPAFKTFLHALESSGIAVEVKAHLAANNASSKSAVFSNKREEILTMALWAKEKIKQNPAAKIACVVPNLKNLRCEILRIFYDVFDSNSGDKSFSFAFDASLSEETQQSKISEKKQEGNDELASLCVDDSEEAFNFSSGVSFNISLGEPLSSFALIRSALQILEMGAHDFIGFDIVLELLRTPFIIGAEKEARKRALCETKLRAKGNDIFTLESLLNTLPKKLILTKILSKYCENLASLFGHFPTCCHLDTSCPSNGPLYPDQSRYSDYQNDTIPRSRDECLKAPSFWAEFFALQLKTFGFPGERSCDSLEYQLVVRFYKLLQEFAGLDVVCAQISYCEAFLKLKHLAEEVIFQAEKADSQIEILGVLEALGLEFDFMWVLGFDAESWPLKGEANPLIPLFLQKQFMLPHVAPEQHLEFVKRAIFSFQKSAKEIIFSYANENFDIKARPLLHLFASPLPDATLQLIELRKKEEIFARNYVGAFSKEKQDSVMEFMVDNLAKKISGEEKIFGGSRILQLQALCPFRAFSEFRLRAKELEEPQFGPTRADRGKLLHAVLDNIWWRLSNKQKLVAFSQAALSRLIFSSIDYTFKKEFQEIGPEDASLLKIERRCLYDLIYDWLALEKERPSFEVVAREKNGVVRLADISLRLRIDRIDRLENGDLVIVDYKTGKSMSSPRDWFSLRPEDPQLPLYAVTASFPVSGIVFARVHFDRMGFFGITKEKDSLPKVKAAEEFSDDGEDESWNKFLNDWQNVLHSIALDFCSGKAQVDPKDQEKTCRFCALSALCRIGFSL